ncbi:MAG: hypothetical protein AB1744_14065, partial [Candidatus Zixiibacteriota bacterium]
TTMLAAIKCGRSSIGVEIDSGYCRLALDRLQSIERSLFSEATVSFEKLEFTYNIESSAAK